MQRDATLVRMEAQEIPKKESLSYIGSIISKDGEIEEDVEHMIKVGLLKWTFVSRVHCDWHIIRLEGRFYRISIRLGIIYGLECWSIRKNTYKK